MPTTGRGAGWHQLVRAARASLSAQSAATTSIERERDYLDKRALGAAQGRLGAESAGAETSQKNVPRLLLFNFQAFQGLAAHAWLCGCARQEVLAKPLRPLAMWSAPTPLQPTRDHDHNHAHALPVPTRTLALRSASLRTRTLAPNIYF